MKKAFVIIPTYNERENIKKVIPLLLDVFKQIKNWEMNILVVDDNSPDNTADEVRQFEKKHDNIFLLLNKRKAGLGSAYLKGMAKAFGELDADVVFEFDADLSHDPTKIPIFLEKIDEGYDMVLGSRYIPGGGIPDNWAFNRKFLSVVGNWVVMTILTNFSVHDWTGGYRALTKKVYEAVEPEMHEEKFTGYTFQIAFLHKTVKKGFKVIEVPFKFVDRTIGESKLPKEYINNNLKYLFKVRLKEILGHRIFKFLMVGGLGAFVQLITLPLFRSLIPQFEWLFLSTLNVSNFLAIEVSIVSNFTFNNLWTFADRKISAAGIPRKFLEFNLASSGSIIIQFFTVRICEALFGIFPILTVPVINYPFDSGTLYVMIGIVIGMFWNFFAYTTLIWKKAKTKP
jgi:dolichol-phosphate mannosyltransferase